MARQHVGQHIVDAEVGGDTLGSGRVTASQHYHFDVAFDHHFVFLNQGVSTDKVGAWLQARDLRVRNVLMDTKRETAAVFKQPALHMTPFFDAKRRLPSGRIGELSPATLTEKLETLAR